MGKDKKVGVPAASIVRTIARGACVLLAAQTALAQKNSELKADLARLSVRHTTEHYALAGTVSDARLVDYGRCLEYIYEEYAQGFLELMNAEDAARGDGANSSDVAHTKDRSARASKPLPKKERSDDAASPAGPKAELPGQGERFPVIIFVTRDEYLQFSNKYFSGGLEFTRGAFVPGLQLLVIQDDSDFDRTYETLFHEAFHQFARRYVPFIPTWINEGLAVHYGNARPTGSGLKFDRPAVGYFRIVKEAKAAKSLIPLDRIMAMSRKEFNKPDPIANLTFTHQQLCYAEAYTLAAYILNDAEGIQLLRKYLKDLARAKNQADVKAATNLHFNAALRDRMAGEWLKFVETK